MPIKKSELYSSIWASCDQLRGGMDASQYKDYVLVLLFVKYVSDKYAGQPFAPIKIPQGASFADMAALKGDKEIGDKINKLIGALAKANDLRGVIDVADFNDPDKLGRGKEMVDRLSNLVAIFETPALDFSSHRVEGDDLLGDAYEYLMRHFATQSGKSKGQFYTPAEVSRIIAQVIDIQGATRQDQTIYDPTCGSGSLLLKAADQAPTGVTIYGQEMDNATAALARMNMIMHGHPSAEIWQDNSLARPKWKTADGRLKTFDFVVANPPFSNKAWRTGFDPENDRYDRFEYGIPPQRNGDYAFLLHILKSLKSTGQGAVILPHGVLFRGNVEADIRRELVRRGAIKGIIGLPPNLFYGTGIPACIIVLDKAHAAARAGGGIFMLDASQGFTKDGNKNRLRHQDIRKIVDVFNDQIALPKYARMVSRAEIAANDYNLNLPRYIDTSAPEDIQDITAHLRGGIPRRDVDDLARYWAVFPGLKTALFAPIDDVETQDLASLRVDINKIKTTIHAHPEFVAYTETVRGIFARWRDAHRPHLLALSAGDRPRALIDRLSESLLGAFAPARLIDKYDVYQHLMAYWTTTMQDDVYMISADGWQAATALRLLRGRSRESADLKLGKLKYKADLIPPNLIIARYFPADQDAIAALAAEQDAVAQQVSEREEEHGGEDGLLDEAKSDAGNITKGAARARQRAIQDDPEFADERAVLDAYLALRDQEMRLGRQIGTAEKALDKKIVEQYAALSEDEIKTLVVDDKWLATLAAAMQGELERVSQTLTARVQELAQRYATPLPEIVAEVDTLSDQVAAHLERMGFTWQ
jgi:type I restriction enzyme M protein